jgi:hypothetical protein
MRCRLLFAISLLAICGCSTNFNNPLAWIGSKIRSSDSAYGQIAPGSTWIDLEHGGGWVRMGADGKVHPIPAPPGVSSATPRAIAGPPQP